MICTLLSFPIHAQQPSDLGAAPSSEISLATLAEQGEWSVLSQRLTSANANVINAPQGDGMTALHWAVYHNRVDAARQLLAAKARPDAKTQYDVTPLSIACLNGNSEIARLLFDAGAGANAETAGGQTLLMTAARTGDEAVIRELIKQGADINAKERKGQTALMWAAAEGNVGAVNELILARADVNHRLKSGFTALMFAAREGRIDVVRRLLEEGVDVNESMEPADTSGRAPRKGMSALMLAVESGHLELAMELVIAGADPNDQRSGFTPLHAITWVRKANRGDSVDGDPPPRGSGHLHSLQFVREIVSAGADVNRKLTHGSRGKAKLSRKGVTPFLLACKTADLPLLNLLLELGADPTLTNVDGTTALMAAAGIGVTAVGEEPGTEPEVMAAIELMMSLGGDPNVVDRNGETAVHGATYRLYPKAIALLTEFGADPEVWNHKNKYGWTPHLIAAGHRPGSLKPSPETEAALDAAKKSAKP